MAECWAIFCSYITVSATRILLLYCTTHTATLWAQYSANCSKVSENCLFFSTGFRLGPFRLRCRSTRSSLDLNLQLVLVLFYSYTSVVSLSLSLSPLFQFSLLVNCILSRTRSRSRSRSHTRARAVQRARLIFVPNPNHLYCIVRLFPNRFCKLVGSHNLRCGPRWALYHRHRRHPPTTPSPLPLSLPPPSLLPLPACASSSRYAVI